MSERLTRAEVEALLREVGLPINGYVTHKSWCWTVVAAELAEPGQATPRALCDCGLAEALAEMVA